MVRARSRNFTLPIKNCQWMNGKTVNLADRRLINPYHPNCLGISPVIGVPQNPIMPAEDPQIPGEMRAMLLKKGVAMSKEKGQTFIVDCPQCKAKVAAIQTGSAQRGGYYEGRG